MFQNSYNFPDQVILTTDHRLFNFVITEITPNAINHIGWRTFLMFGIFCAAMGVFAFFFIKETKGRSLEDMDILFGTVNAEERAVDVEKMLHKGFMHEEMANETVQENKGQSVRLEHVSNGDEPTLA